MVIHNKVKCLFSGTYLKQWKGCALDKRKDSTSIRNDKRRKSQTLRFQNFKTMHSDNYFENKDVMDDYLRKYDLPKLTKMLKKYRGSDIIKDMPQKQTNKNKSKAFKVHCVVVKNGDWLSSLLRHLLAVSL